MRIIRWASNTTLAIALASLGCGGSSSVPKDARVANFDAGSGTGNVGADSAGHPSDTGGASIPDSGMGELVVVEGGVRDGAAETSIPIEVGPGLDLAGADAKATPDAPVDAAAGGQDSGPDAASLGDAPAMGCPPGYHDDGNGTCVTNGAEGVDTDGGSTGTAGARGKDAAAGTGGAGAPGGATSAGGAAGTGGATSAGGAAGSGGAGGGGGAISTGGAGGAGTQCPAGYHNGGNATCVPSGECMAGYHDNGMGICVQTGCATGYHNGGDGSCVPAGTCARGYHDEGDSVCVLDMPAGPGPGTSALQDAAVVDSPVVDASVPDASPSDDGGGCGDGGVPCVSDRVIERMPIDRGPSLHGVDNDSDGVRDDIDAVINNYGASDTDTKHLLDFARALQAAIEVSPDASESVILQLAEKLSRSLQCVLPSQRATKYQGVREIQALSLNTMARVAAYFTNYERRIDGMSFQDVSDPCN
jgi:hypothetical protein